MDYTEVPRSLIFKDRTSLNDFGVLDVGTINNYLFTQMRKLTLLRCGDAKEIALQCFNNAYYICTLIQLDEFPDLCMDKYEKKLLEVKIPFSEDVYQASMALVCVLLAAYDDKYKQKDNPVIESIHHWTSSNKWTGSLNHKSFEDIIEKCCTDSFHFAPNAFAPRDITEVINNVSVDNLVKGKEYVSERLVLIGDKSCRNKILDKVMLRINKDLHELYETWGFDPETNRFEDDEGEYYESDYKLLERVLQEIDEKKAAINYYGKSLQLAPPNFEDSISSIPTTLRINPFMPLTEVIQQTENMSDDNMDKGKDHDTSKYVARIKELEDENKRLKKVLELDKVLEDDNMRLQIDERIIFVSTALGVPWNSGMTNQTQLAKIIEHFSGDSYKSIRSRIVTINKEIKEENKYPGEGLSQGTKEAVNNVIGWLSKATNSKLNTPATDKMIKDIKDVFLNSLE